MDRKDLKSHEFMGRGRGGTTEVDMSTVELAGTFGEAQLLVQGLELLLLEKKKIELMSRTAQGVSVVEKLLESIRYPHYVTEEPLAT